MRKFIFAGLIAATLVPGIAVAQDRDLRDDRRELRDDRRELREDLRDGANDREIRRDMREVRSDQRDARGDWRAWRARHPDYYRGPAWVGPRGGVYRPVAVGYRFDPVYYDRRYLVDPARYHLRPVPGFQRWVRYGRDVLLVDTRNGRVIEVNRAFFY